MYTQKDNIAYIEHSWGETQKSNKNNGFLFCFIEITVLLQNYNFYEAKIIHYKYNKMTDLL